jgi:hypothetical protein
MKYLPEPENREELVALLLLGEVMARRGELGPLARLWRASSRRRTTKRPLPPPATSLVEKA